MIVRVEILELLFDEVLQFAMAVFKAFTSLAILTGASDPGAVSFEGFRRMNSAMFTRNSIPDEEVVADMQASRDGETPLLFAVGDSQAEAVFAEAVLDGLVMAGRLLEATHLDNEGSELTDTMHKDELSAGQHKKVRKATLAELKSARTRG